MSFLSRGKFRFPLFLLPLTFFISIVTNGQTGAVITSYDSNLVTAQSTLIDSIPYNKKRVHLITAAHIAGYGGALIALNEAWYADQPRSAFHFFDDSKQWLQMDKVGHVYSAYVESNASMEMWRWAGMAEKKAVWLGGLTGVAYQSVIEILDGFSSEYGFSVADFSANMIGSAAFISQQLAWKEQKIRLKFSFHKKNYNDKTLNSRTDKLAGKSELERFLKDYNGQTYWVSGNIQAFFPQTKVPRWLNVAVGYGAAGLFGGTENIARDETGTIIFDRRDIDRRREWYLAPDIDLTKIKTNKKGVKVLLFVLNSFKFPAPAISFSKGKFEAHWIAF